MEQPGDIRATDSSSDVLREAGERIETLLNASSVNGVAARERAEDLVRQLTTLYGEGLARVLRILDAATVLEQPVWDALLADEVVAGLLLVHGLHPQDLETRVESALESVRPYLGTHGGNVELLGVTDEGVVSLRMLGSCDGCPSSSVTLELAVESAVEAAAPEVTSIQVTTGSASAAGGASGALVAPVIPISALRSRIGDARGEESGPVSPGDGSGPVTRSGAGAHWAALPELAELTPGEVGGFSVAGVDLLVCRIGSDLFAFADRCPRCVSTMAGAHLERRAGHPVGSGVLVCPACGSHYDVRAAGAGIDTGDGDWDSGRTGGLHLAPFPLLLRDNVFSVALPESLEPVVPG
jgi:Fe-S cluster biogenesis protein NfuA/nitrite reductase/ring-hydroxylating ferredoxin subunit